MERSVDKSNLFTPCNCKLLSLYCFLQPFPCTIKFEYKSCRYKGHRQFSETPEEMFFSVAWWWNLYCVQWSPQHAFLLLCFLCFYGVCAYTSCVVVIELPACEGKKWSASCKMETTFIHLLPPRSPLKQTSAKHHSFIHILLVFHLRCTILTLMREKSC